VAAAVLAGHGGVCGLQVRLGLIQVLSRGKSDLCPLAEWVYVLVLRGRRILANAVLRKPRAPARG